MSGKRKLFILASYLLFGASVCVVESQVDAQEKRADNEREKSAEKREEPSDAESKKQQIKEVEVIVAVRDLDIGEVLAKSDVVTKKFAASVVPDVVATDLKEVIGKRLTARVAKGNFVPSCCLVSRTKPKAINIPKGYSVYSVKPSIESTFQNTLRPGDRIDVIGIVRALYREQQSNNKTR